MGSSGGDVAFGSADIEPLGVCPSTLRSLADELESVVDDLDLAEGAAQTLQSLHQGTSWGGAAFDSFRARSEQNPSPEEVGNTKWLVSSAAGVLRTLAGRLEDAQTAIDWLRQGLDDFVGLFDGPDDEANEQRLRITSDAQAQREEANAAAAEAAALIRDLFDTSDGVAAKPPSLFDRATGRLGDVASDHWNAAGWYWDHVGEEIWKGAGHGVVEGVTGLGDLVEGYGAYATWGWRDVVYRGLLNGDWDPAAAAASLAGITVLNTTEAVIDSARSDFWGFVGTVVEWDTLTSNPAYWFGNRIPTVAAAVATGGIGSAANVIARVGAVTARARRVSALVGKLDRADATVNLLRPLAPAFGIDIPTGRDATSMGDGIRRLNERLGFDQHSDPGHVAQPDPADTPADRDLSENDRNELSNAANTRERTDDNGADTGRSRHDGESTDRGDAVTSRQPDDGQRTTGDAEEGDRARSEPQEPSSPTPADHSDSPGNAGSPTEPESRRDPTDERSDSPGDGGSSTESGGRRDPADGRGGNPGDGDTTTSEADPSNTAGTEGQRAPDPSSPSSPTDQPGQGDPSSPTGEATPGRSSDASGDHTSPHGTPAMERAAAAHGDSGTRQGSRHIDHVVEDHGDAASRDGRHGPADPSPDTDTDAGRRRGPRADHPRQPGDRPTRHGTGLSARDAGRLGDPTTRAREAHSTPVPVDAIDDDTAAAVVASNALHTTSAALPHAARRPSAVSRPRASTADSSDDSSQDRPSGEPGGPTNPSHRPTASDPEPSTDAGGSKGTGRPGGPRHPVDPDLPDDYGDEGAFNGRDDDPSAPMPSGLDDVVEISRSADNHQLATGRLVTFRNGERWLYKPAPTPGGPPVLRRLRAVPTDGYADRAVAAYKVDQRLGFDLVPPTTRWEGPEGWGSMMRWIDGATPGRPVAGPDRGRHSTVDEDSQATTYTSYDEQAMAVEDYVLGNLDRGDDYLTGPDNRPLHIDNDRTLPESSVGGMFSDSVARYRHQPLDPDILARVRAYDPATLADDLRSSGRISEEAIDGAVRRLREVQSRGMITGDAWDGEFHDSSEPGYYDNFYVEPDDGTRSAGDPADLSGDSGSPERWARLLGEEPSGAGEVDSAHFADEHDPADADAHEDDSATGAQPVPDADAEAGDVHGVGGRDVRDGGAADADGGHTADRDDPPKTVQVGHPRPADEYTNLLHDEAPQARQGQIPGSGDEPPQSSDNELDQCFAPRSTAAGGEDLGDQDPGEGSAGRPSVPIPPHDDSGDIGAEQPAADASQQAGRTGDPSVGGVEGDVPPDRDAGHSDDPSDTGHGDEEDPFGVGEVRARLDAERRALAEQVERNEAELERRDAGWRDDHEEFRRQFASLPDHLTHEQLDVLVGEWLPGHFPYMTDFEVIRLKLMFAIAGPGHVWDSALNRVNMDDWNEEDLWETPALLPYKAILRLAPEPDLRPGEYHYDPEVPLDELRDLHRRNMAEFGAWQRDQAQPNRNESEPPEGGHLHGPGHEGGDLPPELMDVVRDVNEGNGRGNCVDCTIAVELRFRGQPTRVTPEGWSDIQESLVRYFGAAFRPVRDRSHIEEILRGYGTGTRAIVAGDRFDPKWSGHAFNAKNHEDDVVYFLDGQVGGAASFEGLTNFRLMVIPESLPHRPLLDHNEPEPPEVRTNDDEDVDDEAARNEQVGDHDPVAGRDDGVGDSRGNGRPGVPQGDPVGGSSPQPEHDPSAEAPWIPEVTDASMPAARGPLPGHRGRQADPAANAAGESQGNGDGDDGDGGGEDSAGRPGVPIRPHDDSGDIGVEQPAADASQQARRTDDPSDGIEGDGRPEGVPDGGDGCDSQGNVGRPAERRPVQNGQDLLRSPEYRPDAGTLDSPDFHPDRATTDLLNGPEYHPSHGPVDVGDRHLDDQSTIAGDRIDLDEADLGPAHVAVGPITMARQVPGNSGGPGPDPDSSGGARGPRGQGDRAPAGPSSRPGGVPEPGASSGPQRPGGPHGHGGQGHPGGPRWVIP